MDGFDTCANRQSSGFVSVGYRGGIFVLDDWMVFTGSRKKGNSSETPWYVMRTDDSNLHKLGEDYALADTMGLVDSTGQWRYRMLADGTATIVGAGSKLKRSGKLAIHAAVGKIPVTVIGESAFSHYFDFTSVTIPKGVATIEDYAFGGATSSQACPFPRGHPHRECRVFNV